MRATRIRTTRATVGLCSAGSPLLMCETGHSDENGDLTNPDGDGCEKLL